MFAPPSRPAPGSGGAATPATAVGAPRLWGAARGWPAPPPPYALDEEMQLDDAALAAFAGHPWLFPNGIPGAAARAKPRRPVPQRNEQAQAWDTSSKPLVEYSFKYLREENARAAVRRLLSPGSLGNDDETLAVCFGRALERYALDAYQFALRRPVGDRVALQAFDQEIQRIPDEADAALRQMVAEGVLTASSGSPTSALVFCLEAFGVSRRRSKAEKVWLTGYVQRAVKAVLDAVSPEDRARWFQESLARVRDADADLYGKVDVRAWPAILQLLQTDSSELNSDLLATHIRMQLCFDHDAAAARENLEQAAELIGELRVTSVFTIEELLDTFNDSHRLDWKFRLKLLTSVLRHAPYRIVANVLQGIGDESGVDIVGEDPELELSKSLVRNLRADVRWSPGACYQMKCDWVSSNRGSGVVANMEMTVEQVCDHIEEDEDGYYEDLLKLAVNRYKSNNNLFEAARMLARPRCALTKVLQNERNHKQLSYLISLFQQVEPPVDRFAPIEQDCLIVPRAPDLIVDGPGDALDRLERELDSAANPPKVVGIYWFWRCLDPRLDFWCRASLVALSYGNTFALVDLINLETDAAAERRAKALLVRLLEAPEILKVVHAVDDFSLQILQRALVPKAEWLGDSPPIFAKVSPVVDVAVVLALVRHASPGDKVAKLPKAIWEYFGMELCTSEALGNFDRRPLRKTQQHYALTLAWAPVLILRTFCTFGVLSPQHLCACFFRLGFPDIPDRWDEQLRRVNFGSGQSAAAPARWTTGGNAGDAAAAADENRAFAENLWETDQEWVRTLSRPDGRLDLRRLLQSARLGALVVPPEVGRLAETAARSLYDRGASAVELQEVYAPYAERVAAQKAQKAKQDAVEEAQA